MAGFDGVVFGGIVGYPDMIEVGFRDEIQALEKQTRTGSNYPRRAIINMNDPYCCAPLQCNTTRMGNTSSSCFAEGW